jgi:uncharacterized protein YjbI with pentapeptide repeats
MRFVKLRSRLNGDNVLNLSNFDFSPLAKNLNFWNFLKYQIKVHFETLKKVYFRNSILSGLDLSLTNFNSTNSFWLPNDSLLIDNGGLLPAPNLYFDFKNAKLTYTNLTGLNFKRSNFNQAILNKTKIEYCSFTNTRYLQFKSAILENIDIGRGIFIDGQLVLDKKRIEKFFSDQGATSISFRRERPIYSSHVKWRLGFTHNGALGLHRVAVRLYN